MIEVNGESQPLILASLTSLRVNSFRERVEIAAEAGFDAIGLSLDTYRQLAASELKPKEIKKVVEGSGLRVAELEAVFGFSLPVAETGVPTVGGFTFTSPDDLQELFEMAELFGARHLQATGAFGRTELEPDAAERFADLCDRAADFGLKIALEFMPTTNILDAETALSIVEDAGRPNGGLCIDAWHHTRGANNLEFIRAIPKERVMLIQLDDGSAEPRGDFITETMRSRQVPGEGEFDLQGLITAVYSSGASAPVSVEVLSDTLLAEEPRGVAHRYSRCSAATVAQT